MERNRLKKSIGLAMVGLGAIQTVLFALQRDWIPMALGLLYGGIGLAYLWAEVYAIDR